jgi:hypothetical protein
MSLVLVTTRLTYRGTTITSRKWRIQASVGHILINIQGLHLVHFNPIRHP